MRLASFPVVMLMVMFVAIVVVMPMFVEMLVRIMKMDMAFADDLTNQIVKPEKKEGSARDPWKPGTDCSAESRSEQRYRQTERRRDDDVSGSGESSHGDGLGSVPSLDPRRKDERKPVSRNGGMKKRDPKSSERDGGEDGLIH